MLPPERRLERSRAENIKANGFPRRREPRDSGAFRFLKNQINRSLRKTIAKSLDSWNQMIGRRPLPPSARHRPSLRSPSTVRRLPPLARKIFTTFLLSVARRPALADLDTRCCARLQRSGPQHRRIRARRFFFAARKRQPNMTDFRSDFQLCCGAKTAGSFAFPLSAIIFANARRDVGTTACVRRCDHGADDN